MLPVGGVALPETLVKQRSATYTDEEGISQLPPSMYQRKQEFKSVYC